MVKGHFIEKRLILVGGSHAHLVTLANLHRMVQQGHHVTVIGSGDYHYYSSMGPGMLGHFYTPRQIRFATRQWVAQQGAVFVRFKGRLAFLIKNYIDRRFMRRFQKMV